MLVGKLVQLKKPIILCQKIMKEDDSIFQLDENTKNKNNSMDIEDEGCNIGSNLKKKYEKDIILIEANSSQKQADISGKIQKGYLIMFIMYIIL
jgi:isoaspartyl peptidase/L-asparaginase-like protein (Ntn-hydrolase superfamily)